MRDVKSDSYVYCGVEMQSFSNDFPVPKHHMYCNKEVGPVSGETCKQCGKSITNLIGVAGWFTDYKRVLYTEGSGVAYDRITGLWHPSC